MIYLKARSDRNRWGLIALMYLAGYLIVAILIQVGVSLSTQWAPAAVVYGGILVVTASLIFMTRRMTEARAWWLLPLFLSPASVTLEFILLINVLMWMGVIQC